MNNSDLIIAKKAAIAAGREILEIYNSADFDVKLKSDNSPLTRADRVSHGIIASLLSCSPYPILSEEGADIPYDERKGWERYWLIDPLDGTKEFIKRNGEFTVNIAVIDRGRPVLGVVYVPVTDVLYWGVWGEGSFKQRGDEKPIALPVEGEDKTFTVVASRSHLSEETRTFIAKLETLYPGLACQSSGSSLKLCRVAEGSAQVYPRFAPTMEWDTAAADAVCRAAGIHVYDVKTKKELEYNKRNLLNPWFLVTGDEKIKDLL